MLALAIILRNIRLIAAGALVIFAVAYRMVLVRERDSANRRVAVLETENASLRTVNSALTSAVNSQNAAIADLRSKARAAQAREQAAVLDAARVAGESKYETERLLQAQVPSECPDAMRWLATKGAELGKW